MKIKTTPTILALAFVATLALAIAPSSVFAAAEEANITNVTITLNQPQDNQWNNSGGLTINNNFSFTPTINGTLAPAAGILAVMNCTVYTNISGSWGFNNSNTSAIANATIEAIGIPNLVESSASYIWNVNCTINTSGITPDAGMGYFAAANFTVKFDRGAPNISVTGPDDAETFSNNPCTLTYTCNETCNVTIQRINYTGSASDVLINHSIGNRTAASTSTDWTYIMPSGNTVYWFQINATDEAGNTVTGSNYSFWYNLTASTGGAGGRVYKRLPAVVDEVPAEVPAVVAPPSVGPLQAFTSGVSEGMRGIGTAILNVPAAIADFFKGLLGIA